MVHFVRQMQAFCQLEVIECSWQSLIEFIQKREGDLDSLVQAHRTYLDRVVRKVLLLGSKRDKEVSQATDLEEADPCIGDSPGIGERCSGSDPAIQRCYSEFTLRLHVQADIFRTTCMLGHWQRPREWIENEMKSV
jgi:hypothetical protein